MSRHIFLRESTYKDETAPRLQREYIIYVKIYTKKISTYKDDKSDGTKAFLWLRICSVCEWQVLRWRYSGYSENQHTQMIRWNKGLSMIMLTVCEGQVLWWSWLPFSTDSYFHDFVFVFVSCVSLQIWKTQEGNLLGASGNLQKLNIAARSFPSKGITYTLMLRWFEIHKRWSQFTFVNWYMWSWRPELTSR